MKHDIRGHESMRKRCNHCLTVLSLLLEELKGKKIAAQQNENIYYDSLWSHQHKIFAFCYNVQVFYADVNFHFILLLVHELTWRGLLPARFQGFVAFGPKHPVAFDIV